MARRPYIRGTAQRLAFYSRRDPSGCLLWTGHTDRDGYGDMCFHRRGTIRVHRVAWEVAHGAIPPGISVCHKCDVRNCIEPKHLFLGTMADNNADKVAKGRHNSPKGEAHCRAKVTEDQVRQIYDDRRKVAVIAAEYGLNESTVYRIKNRQRWKHVL